MTDTPPEAPAAQQPIAARPDPSAPRPAADPAEQKKASADPETGISVPQLALAGATSTVLIGSYVALTFGPWALAGVAGVAAAGGVAAVQHRFGRRTSRGRRGPGSGSSRASSAGSSSRRGGGALLSPGSQSGRRAAAAHSGGASASRGRPGLGSQRTPGAAPPRAGGRPTGGSVRPGGGSGARGAQRPSANARPASGGQRRGGSWSPSSGANRGRGRVHSTGDGSLPRLGGRGSRGSGSAPAGRLRKAAAKGRSAAGRAFDSGTGGRAATAWKAAKGASSPRTAARSARHALRHRDNHNAALTGLFSLGAAMAWISRNLHQRAKRRAGAHLDRVYPTPKTTTSATAGGPANTKTASKKTTTAPRSAASTTRGGTAPAPVRSSMFPIVVASTEMPSAAARYAPQDMWAVVQDARQLGDIARNAALAIRTYTERLEAEYPVHPAVLDELYRYYQALAAAAPAGDDVHAAMQEVHKFDIERAQARRNERLWNV